MEKLKIPDLVSSRNEQLFLDVVNFIMDLPQNARAGLRYGK
jgi:hypothetical protein